MSNDELELEKQGSKFVNWVKKNAPTLVALVISVFFVVNGSIRFVPTEMDWWGRIAYICTTLVFGILISSLVSEGGYASGKRNKEFIDTRRRAVDLCDKALPYKKEVELYVLKKIERDIMQERIEILSKASIMYEEIFDINGIPVKVKDFRKKYSRKQRGAIRKAIRIKKVPFALFGFTTVKLVGRREAPSEVKRRRNKVLSSFLIKAFLSLITGSIMFQFLGLSIESVLYSLFQLCIWFGSGFYARIGNYNFIVVNVKEYDQERISYLEEFLALPQEEKNKLRDDISLKESENEGVKRLTMTIQKEKEETANAN